MLSPCSLASRHWHSHRQTNAFTQGTQSRHQMPHTIVQVKPCGNGWESGPHTGPGVAPGPISAAAGPEIANGWADRPRPQTCMWGKPLGLHQQALLLLLSVSSLQWWHGTAAAAAAVPPAPQQQSPAGEELLSGGQLLDSQTLPLWTKPSNVTDASADSVAPAWVRLRYLAPSYSQGPSGRWDNYDYGDERNSNPASYCPRACRVVSTRIARCQCVTRSSLQAFYSGRR